LSTYQSLYRKYRPAIFSEILGQRHVTQTLANAIGSGRISHAYLFCGPRGTGKTTTARSLAMSLNCEKGPTAQPCGKCNACLEIRRGACLDVIEFDAASHRGVDDMEELRHRFQFAPGQTRYKVYIIDEVHQLSDQAFDMLLKVLEEPPQQVVFILATTDPHKVKPTILSRCQRFDFHRIGPADLQICLKQVCEQENLKYEEAALSLLAQAADGAARDALSLLEQAAAYAPDKITIAEVRAILGGIEPDMLIEVADSIIQGKVDAAFALVDRVVAEGNDLVQLVKEVTKYFRDLLMIKISQQGPAGELAGTNMTLPQEYLPRMIQQAKEFPQRQLLEAIDFLCRTEGDLRFSSQPRLLVELCLARCCGLNQTENRPVEQPARPAPPPVAGPPKRTEPIAKVTTAVAGGIKEAVKAPEKPEAKAPPPAAAGNNLEVLKESWPKVLETLKKERQALLHSVMNDAAITRLEGQKLTLTFSSEFQHASLNSPEKKDLLAKVIEKVTGQQLRIECELKSAQQALPEKKDDSPISQALSIFPGSEVL